MQFSVNRIGIEMCSMKHKLYTREREREKDKNVFTIKKCIITSFIM